MAENKGGHGGKRPGAGRKPRYQNSDAFLSEVDDAEQEWIQYGCVTPKYEGGGLSVAQNMIHQSQGGDARVSGMMLKTIAGLRVVAASEKDVSVTKHEGPGVLLPPRLDSTFEKAEPVTH